MYKLQTIISTLIVFLIGMSDLRADLVLTSGVSETDFNDAFSNDRVWYAQFQPGAPDESNNPGDTHPDNEFEIGGETLRYYEGNTATINDEANNPFEISVSETAFLSATFNGVGTPGGSQYGITKKFNTIWIGLKSNFSYNSSETVAVINHDVDTGDIAILPEMQVTATQTMPIWNAFKFYIDDQLDNISSITITGDILPDMYFGGAYGEDWTYTVFATHDPSIVPEPSTLVMLLGAFAAFSALWRRKNKFNQTGRQPTLLAFLVNHGPK